MSKAEQSSRVYYKIDGLVEADVDNEIILLDTKSWQYFGFDRVGTEIWKQLCEPRGLDAIVNALLEQFDVTRDKCRNDAATFLREMQAKGLIVARDA